MLLPSRKKHSFPSTPLPKEAARSTMFVPLAVGHGELRYSMLLCSSPFSQEFKCLNMSMQIEQKKLLFINCCSFCLFSSLPLYIFLFLLPWNIGGFLFSLYIWFPLLISFVLTLLLVVWWGGPDSGFLLLGPVGNVAVWKSTVVFQQFFRTCAGHLPRACFLLLYLIKIRRRLLVPMEGTWCHVGFSVAWNHTSPW